MTEAVEQESGRRFVVVCTRFDGRERRWKSYSDRREAEKVAAHLTRVGCPARVATDDEPAVEVAAK